MNKTFTIAALIALLQHSDSRQANQMKQEMNNLSIKKIQYTSLRTMNTILTF